MKVIFLDVDGVLNSSQDGFNIKLETRKHLVLLKQLVDETGAEIVLSSSWRIYDKTRVFIKKKLEEYGIALIGFTPDTGESKGKEIKKWLDETPYSIESFVILDDDADMGEYSGSKLVLTDINVGLQEVDVRKAINILHGLEWSNER